MNDSDSYELSSITISTFAENIGIKANTRIFVLADALKGKFYVQICNAGSCLMSVTLAFVG